MTNSTAMRWQALDWLRGLSIIGMLFNLTPGAWEKEYDWMIHAKWEGGNLIDMVAPAFLFCIGAALPLSLSKRMKAGQSKAVLWRRGLWRAAVLVAVGLFLNGYPVFDVAHMRFPGVLQKIGLAFALAFSIVLMATRRSANGEAVFKPQLLCAAMAFILVSHWALLYFVPVPGFGAPRFDPLGSWPAYIDRGLFTVPHMFIYWPVNGQVLFDPDGLLNVYTSCANILIGVLAGLAYMSGKVRRPVLTAFAAGAALMAAALALSGICPIIKNIHTATFVLFSGGFSLALLGLFTLLADLPKSDAVLFPLQVYGANPLLAYVTCFLVAPLLDHNWAAPGGAYASIRSTGQEVLSRGLDPYAASFSFGLIYLVILFLVLRACYRRHWFLKL
ncbi:acyltransferase family protein [Pseudoduganella sp. UC29_106]|uniref:acyltransferase family protein n=1 Tax=Pseudoduganella sp. UC29_106 TaxID=3374553 RepID=UPI003757DDAF